MVAVLVDDLKGTKTACFIFAKLLAVDIYLDLDLLILVLGRFV